ncbi:hypothetical protein ABPG75_005800 [Micractinium tetrahymenae]
MPQREADPLEAERRLTPLWEQLLRRAAGTERVPGVLVEAWQVQLAQARKLPDSRNSLFLLENARPAPPVPGITSDHAAILTLCYELAEVLFLNNKHGLLPPSQLSAAAGVSGFGPHAAGSARTLYASLDSLYTGMHIEQQNIFVNRILATAAMAEAAKRGGRDEAGNLVGSGTALSKPLSSSKRQRCPLLAPAGKRRRDNGSNSSNNSLAAAPAGATGAGSSSSGSSSIMAAGQPLAGSSSAAAAPAASDGNGGMVCMPEAAPHRDTSKQPPGSCRVIHHFRFRGTYTAIRVRVGGVWLELSSGSGAWGWDFEAAFLVAVMHRVVAELGLSMVTDLVPSASCSERRPGPPQAPLPPLPLLVKGLPLVAWRLTYQPVACGFMCNLHDVEAAGKKGGTATKRRLGFDAAGRSNHMVHMAELAMRQRLEQRLTAIASTERFVVLPGLGELGSFEALWFHFALGEHPWAVEEANGARGRGPRYAAWRQMADPRDGADVNMAWSRIVGAAALVLVEADLQGCDLETAVERLDLHRSSLGLTLSNYVRYRRQEELARRRVAGLRGDSGQRGNKMHTAVLVVADSILEERGKAAALAEQLAADHCRARRSAKAAMRQDGWTW